MSIPYIDPEVEYVGIAALKHLTKEKIADKTMVVINQTTPIAVLIPYRTYLTLQSLLELPKANVATVVG